MDLFSLLAVLLIEQFRPLPYQRLVHDPLSRVAQFLERSFNAGERKQGILAYVLGVGGLVLVSGLINAALYALHPLFAWLFNVAVLYLTLGFRQFSHYFTDIQLALRMDDLPQARQLLAQWRHLPCDDLSSSEVARLSIESALSAAHKHVFGVLVCFVILPGPCGAVLYRAAQFFADAWAKRADTETFGRFAEQALVFIDWLPQRVTALTFAIVGNFEDALYCWRTQAGKASDTSLRLVLACGAGALGVRLGVPASPTQNSENEGDDATDNLADQAEFGVGGEADVDVMQSTVGLIWRALILWMLVLFLLSFASFSH